jgi:catechol 2,3-dioxygenase-like lactoylglutathione lyase family enzyme
MRRRTFVGTAAILAGLAMLSLAGRLAAADNPAAKGHANARLCAFSVEGDKTEHVFYRDHDGDVVELFTKQGDNTGWHTTNLTVAATAPKAASGPNAFYEGDTKTSHVFYRGTDDGIHELYRDSNGKWAHNDLTKGPGAPKAAGEPAGYAEEGNKTEHVVFRTGDGDLIELYSKYGETAGWKLRDLTKDAGAPRAAGSPDAFYWPSTKSQHVVYRGSDDNVHELFMEPNGKWSHMNLTEGSKAPKAAGDPSAYLENQNNTEHVCYRTAEGDVVQLYAKYKGTDGWHHEDLTAATKAPKAAGDPSGYRLRESALRGITTQHVVYRGEEGDVHELFMGGAENKWAHNDISKEANAPRAAGDPAGYVFEADRTQHVVFQTADSNILELYNVPDGPQRGWHGKVLTAVKRNP